MAENYPIHAYAFHVDRFTHLAYGPRMQVDHIISKFGGLTKLARALNMKHPTTAQGWKVRGSIPARHIPKIIEAARAQNIDLSLGDFFQLADGSPQPDKNNNQ